MQSTVEFVVAQNGDAGGWILRRTDSNERPLVFPTKEAAMDYAGSEFMSRSSESPEVAP